MTARYNADGTLDSGFGTGGIVTTKLSSDGNDEGHAVAIAADGTIVTGGTSGLGNTDSNFALMRYVGDPAINPTGVHISPTVHALFTGTVATFTAADAQLSAGRRESALGIRAGVADLNGSLLSEAPMLRTIAAVFGVVFVASTLLADDPKTKAKPDAKKDAKEMSVTLVKVDADTKMIRVRTGEGRQVDLKVGDETSFIGPRGGVSEPPESCPPSHNDRRTRRPRSE
jgi:hypothetical protein